MTELLLIRHGVTVGNELGQWHGVTDWPLSTTGEQQAATLADVLEPEVRPAALYTSPLQRARQTAAAIGDRIGLTPLSVSNLAECDYGDCEGLTAMDLMRQHPLVHLKIHGGIPDDLTFPNGEGIACFHERIRRALSSIVSDHPNERVIVVSHDWVIASGLAWLITGSATGWTRYRTRNGSVSRLKVAADRRARLVEFNRLYSLTLVK